MLLQSSTLLPRLLATLTRRAEEPSPVAKLFARQFVSIAHHVERLAPVFEIFQLQRVWSAYVDQPTPRVMSPIDISIVSPSDDTSKPCMDIGYVHADPKTGCFGVGWG